jgi:NAD(P)-dependent dehydrogenase (short-subunit alcohol dehydrogenase family)
MKGYVLITGANGGLGCSLVETFTDAGYGVIGTDITSTSANSSVESFIQTDLARFVEDESYAHVVTNDILDILQGNGLKALINNAAVQILGKAEELQRNDWRRTLDINLLAPFFLTQSLLAVLEKGNGCVVNISSIHARLTKENFTAYATSKAALSAMTRAVAVDLGPRVRVNAIEPAAIETAMLKDGFKDNPEAYSALQRYHPLMRIGRPDEIARLALAIVDGGFEFLHGATIGIDGAISARLYDPC